MSEDMSPYCSIAVTRSQFLRRLLCDHAQTAAVWKAILTTNLAACVCVCAKFYQFLPLRSYFVSKRPENFVRLAKFPYAAFGPLFAFHCPLFFTRNDDL